VHSFIPEMARPTRFERVTFAFGRQGLLERRAPPQKSSRLIGELFCLLRYSGFSCSRAAKTSTALHSIRRTHLCVIFGIDSLDLEHQSDGGICSMAVVWTFNVPDAGTRRVFSIEDGIWDGQMTSVSATGGRTLGASLGIHRQIRTRGGGLGDDFKAASLQRYFWVRNAPWSSGKPCNCLILRQMRPPSERTTGISY
jgi:hypothetical protein